MVLGMSLETFTFLHVVISMVGIMTGLIVVAVMLQNGPIAGWNGFFLTTTILTSVTGFFFPSASVLPSHVVGIISLLLLVVALVARYGFHLVGAWRWAFVGGVVSTLWFDVFVAIVQAFQKVPALHALAPTQSEPPFAIVQIATLIGFIAIGVAAGLRFRRAAMA